MVTVKCQVVKNEPGNPVVGLVYGNHKKDPNKAKDDADLYTNKFGKMCIKGTATLSLGIQILELSL